MKTPASLILLLSAQVALHANPIVIPIGRAKLIAETVDVRMLRERAEVIGSYEFEPWMTSDAKKLYLPMFASDSVDPIKLLARTGLEAEVNGQPTRLPEPCAAPWAINNLPAAPKIVWFSTSLEDLIEDDIPHESAVIRVRYSQPLIDGKFYYLPIITGHVSSERPTRNSRYELRAHASKRVVRVLSEASDFEQRDEGVVVYLRDQELVILQ